MQVQAILMAKYIQLKEYATSLNLSLVSIRLQEARNAVETADQQKFESLARGIWSTLEDHYNAVAAARKELLVPNFSTPASLAEVSRIVEVQGESQTYMASINSQQSVWNRL